MYYISIGQYWFSRLREILNFVCFILQKVFPRRQINTISTEGWIKVVQDLYKTNVANLNWEKWEFIFMLVEVVSFGEYFWEG